MKGYDRTHIRKKREGKRYFRFPSRCRGAGGSRTLVQTGNPKAFYMLIRRFILLSVPGIRQPNTKPSPLNFAANVRTGAAAIFSLSIPRCRRNKKRVPPAGYSSPHLLGHRD